ncbi:WD40/YVTN/BNR-like repeat-containing protein [Flavobacterium wongokense]|uniref:WD40/YVTN/BNR-like repeat-containing protein n=1 Tax=Flavobacterium wongokense TaxID=2910674 RepID=UPI001F40C002|nr:YCF48-related protein [Flavobacterium sp. WG47]MCF6132781.1 YCF48-related protein [Flavobacterium sp. WG47]
MCKKNIMKKAIYLVVAVATFYSCSDSDEVDSSKQLLSESFTRVRVDVGSPFGGITFDDISFCDEANGVMGGSSGTIIKTNDGGLTWTSMTGTDATYSSVFMFNPSTVYAGRRDFYKMNENNAMIARGDLGQDIGTINDIHFYTATTGFALKGSTVLKSTDAGNSWGINFEESIYIKGLCYASQNVIYAWGGDTREGLSGAVLFKTTDGGNNWTEMSIQTSEIKAMQFLDKEVGFMVNHNSEFLKTTDGGVTWTMIARVPYAPYHNGGNTSLLYVNEKQIFVTNLDGQLLKSSDGGTNWQSIYEHPEPDGAFTKIIRVNKTLYVAGSYGYLLKNGYLSKI